MLLDITMSSEIELIPIALGVMVNLCHKNKPVIYILMNCVDMKTFLRALLSLQRDNVGTSVQVGDMSAKCNGINFTKSILVQRAYKSYIELFI